MWYKKAKIKIEDQIKNILKSHKFFNVLMRYYGISKNDIDNNLNIIFKDLEGKYAEGNGNEIYLNKKIFENNSLKDNFHFIVHEFFHWVKRRSEDKFYFNDPEEIQSFIIAMTWELIRGKDIKEVCSLFYPIVYKYFTDKEKANNIFRKMIEQSKNLKEIYNNG